MPCPSLWRQKCSPHVSTIPRAGSTWPPTHRAPTPPRGYTDESPRGSTAESDSRWQFPITVAFPIPRALSTLQRGRWNVPTHHHATVGRHGHTRTVVPSRRTECDLDDQLGDGAQTIWPAGAWAFPPVIFPIHRPPASENGFGHKRSSRIPLTEGTSSPLPHRGKSIAGRQWIFYAAEKFSYALEGK